MLAFVLSGAGNRGPLEVGALRALFEAGIVPDMLVGTSAGAINASYVAAHGATVATTEALGDLWRGVTSDTIYPENPLQVAWRLRSRALSLYSSTAMRAMLAANLPATFGDLAIKLYTPSTDLTRARLYVFGDDPAAALVDAVLASASVPVIHPPVQLGELHLVDGAALANVPASIAMDKGADTIYVVNAAYGGGQMAAPKGVLNVLGLAFTTMLGASLLEDIDRAKQDPDVDLYHIHLPDFAGLSFMDFSQTDAMIEAGYQRAKAYLAAPPPAFVPAPADESPFAPGEAGAETYAPPFMR
ncbi:MAG: patatin-like phospholipase family protein [Caldilineaceae bacterium]|nr:patatin-like phospholipase family protein [Caldilineaceae bacterium]